MSGVFRLLLWQNALPCVSSLTASAEEHKLHLVLREAQLQRFVFSHGVIRLAAPLVRRSPSSCADIVLFYLCLLF